MAISFSRPDPSSPAAVGSAAFSSSRRGFDPSEVREFLRMVAAEMARLQERERFLEGELRAIQTSGMSAPGQLDEETVITLLGEEAARVLSTAREASIQIRDRAEESATRMVKDAAQDAGRIREQAALDAKGIRDDSQSDANSEIELAKQQGRDMVEEARAYREKVLSELLRRRDAAREQIEQLLHGRDRLMNAFERARLATEDVLGGLSDAHEDPEFLVNLAPTTGPVPPVIAVAPHVSQEHPSHGIFDHDTASIVMPTQEIVEEIVQEEEIAHEEEIVQEEEIAHEEEIVQEEESSPVEPLEKMATVVSIFGGSRRSNPAPEITNDDKAERHVEIEKEVSSPEPETKSPGAQVVDDIFARLRASSPAEVAKNIAKDVKDAKDTKDVKESKIKLVKSLPKKPIAITPILDTQKFSDRDASIAPLIVSMSKKLKRVGADELNAVLEHLNVKKSSLEIAAIVGTTSAHTKHHAVAINDDIMAAATEGAKSMKSSGGSTKRITKKAVGDAVNAMLLETIVQPLRDRLAKIVVDSNGNREDIAKAVRIMYRDWKLTHIDAHTEDLACVAYSMGSHLSLEVGTPVCWMVDPNGPECADAEDNALSGVTPCGEKFPTGHEHPLAHSGCRCLVAPPTH
jgi:DivIVA domain-containing protein